MKKLLPCIMIMFLYSCTKEISTPSPMGDNVADVPITNDPSARLPMMLQARPSLRITLYNTEDTSIAPIAVDSVFIPMDSSYSNGVGPEDIQDIVDGTDDLSLRGSSALWSTSGIKIPPTYAVLGLKTQNYTVNHYSFTFTPVNFPAGYLILLIDSDWDYSDFNCSVRYKNITPYKSSQYAFHAYQGEASGVSHRFQVKIYKH